MRAFDYLEPASAGEACRMLADAGPTARPLAGGTDLLIQIEMRKVLPDTLVYLGRAEDLGRIDGEAGRGLRIGGAVTMRAIELHPVVRERYPALERACAEVGSVQIRNLATLAGNAANASPSADTSPALLAYDAEVEMTGPGGTRSVPISEFWTGPSRTVLQAGEIISAIHLPPTKPDTHVFYRKLAVRKAMDLAMVGVCVAASNGDVRIALGAVAPVCMRATGAEALARDGGASSIDAAAAAAAAACSPITDQRASAEYRREMVRVLTRRGLAEVLR